MTMMTRGPTLLVHDPGGLMGLLVSGLPVAGFEGKKPVRKVEKRIIRKRNLETGCWTERGISQL